MLHIHALGSNEPHIARQKSSDGDVYDIDTQTLMMLLSSCGVSFAWKAARQRDDRVETGVCFKVDANHPRWTQTASDVLREAMPRINHYVRQRVWEGFGEPDLEHYYCVGTDAFMVVRSA